MSNENINQDSMQSQGQQFWGMQENTYCMLMHLAIFANPVAGAGLILQIVMWAMNKDKSQVIDQNGKNIVNFLISYTIYAIAALPLVLIGVGLLVLLAIAIVGIVFPIIAAVKANDGIYWPYPLCIRFFK